VSAYFGPCDNEKVPAHAGAFGFKVLGEISTSRRGGGVAGFFPTVVQWQTDPAVSFVGNDHLTINFACGGAFGGTCPLPMAYGLGGALGGVQAGYNWQVNQKWLLGIEADIDAAGIKGTGTNPTFQIGSNPSNFQETQSVDWFGTVRARFGFLATPNLLLFGTGGFAYGKVRENTGINMPGGGSGESSGVGFDVGYRCISVRTNCFFGSSSRIATGWTAGAGLEYAFWKNVTVKGEYLYVNLGGGDVVNVAVDAFVPQLPSRRLIVEQIFRSFVLVSTSS
jgi:outer membrane immunogenic protein